MMLFFFRPENTEYEDGGRSQVALEAEQVIGDSFPSNPDGAMYYPSRERYITLIYIQSFQVCRLQS